MADEVSEQDSKIEALREQSRKWLDAIPQLNIKDFFENSPPDTQCRLADFRRSSINQISAPDLDLFCENSTCSGTRIFRNQGNDPYIHDESRFLYLTYRCSNCNAKRKYFSLTWRNAALHDGTLNQGILAQKLGEFPAFGPRLPSRLISLIGPDRETLLQGSRSEARGLGIGAFAYYRRVVENQKNRIIAEIAKVAQLVSPSESQALFEQAIKEDRFKQSIELIKDALPRSLFINGNNPLTLLHSALSSGLHDPDMTDAACLELAQSIRTVLTELAERIALALKSDQEISSALSVLLAHQRRSKSEVRATFAKNSE